MESISEFMIADLSALFLQEVRMEALSIWQAV